MSVRIVVADDHPIVVDGLVGLFSTEPDFKVVARASDGDQALEAIRRARPDVAVLDIRMPGKDVITIVGDIKRENIPTRVVFLTAFHDVRLIEGVRLGVQGVVTKDMASRFLIECIRAVHAGDRWVERKIAAAAIHKLVESQQALHEFGKVLTPREIEVAHMVAGGRRIKAIAEQLLINESTARLHLHHVYAKLKVDGRIGLMQYMQRRGFV